LSLKFSKKALDEFEGIAKRYPVRRAALLPALWLAQKEFGWLPPDAIELCAGLVGCSPAQALEVAEFYSMYKKKEGGKYHLQVCQTISCLLNGSEEIKKVVEQKLGLKPGETTPDGQFSYQPVECLAGCHTGPCMQVNDDYHEHLTPKKMEELIEELKKK